MTEHYYLLFGDKQSGPYTLSQLQAMWASGQITALTRWCAEGMKEWQPLSTLESRFHSPPVIQTPPMIPQSVPIAYQHPAKAAIVRRSSVAGGGCALQAIGLLCLILAVVTVFTIVGPIFFGILGLWLLIYGNSKASWLECSACGGKVSNRRIVLCPHCKASF
jgi:hypothetical protein